MAFICVCVCVYTYIAVFHHGEYYTNVFCMSDKYKRKLNKTLLYTYMYTYKHMCVYPYRCVYICVYTYTHIYLTYPISKNDHPISTEFCVYPLSLMICLYKVVVNTINKVDWKYSYIYVCKYFKIFSIFTKVINVCS